MKKDKNCFHDGRKNKPGLDLFEVKLSYISDCILTWISAHFETQYSTDF